jgi:hypothetical protein
MSNFCVAVEDGEECGRKAENRELGLCATHNKARRVSERPPPPPKQYKGLKPGKPLSNGSTLRPVSDKQKVKNAAKAAAFKVVDATQPHHCVSCGCTEMLTHSHVLTDKQFEKHEANPRNILLECQDCHNTWEHNKREAKAKHASWALKMEIWEELEPQDFMRFKIKNPALFPTPAG